MTTSASRPINSTETAFSYAAAASGKNSAGSAPSKLQPSSSSKPSASSSTGPPPTQRPVSSASSSTPPNMNGSTAPTTGTSTPQSLPTVVANSHPKANGEMNSTIPSAVSSPSIGSVSTSTLPKEDDSMASVSSALEDKTTSWEKQSQTSSREDKKTSSAGSRTPDVFKDVILVPAPLPHVNPWAKKSNSAKKPNTPVTVPSAPAAAKAPAGPSNATAFKDNVDKLAELKQKKSIGENLDVLEKEKPREGFNGVGKDGLAREPRDRKKSIDAGRVNGYVGKDDARKSGRKAHQQPEKELAAPVPPPPVTDVSSWPTPEIAQDEAEKAKREKDEKDKTTSSGVRPSQKWVPVTITTPYVPPFPSKSGRGGRTGRGGREGGSRSAGGGTGGVVAGAIPSSSSSGEKHAGGAFGSVSGAGVENDRGRQGSGAGPSRGGYQGNKNGKRATSTGGTTQRRESKGSLPISPQEKRKELATGPEVGETAPELVQSAKTSSTGTQTQTEKLRRGSRVEESSFVAQGDGRQFPENQERSYQNSNGQSYHPRSERGSYQAFNSNRSDHHGMGDTGSTHVPRERGYEGGRGRGGYRGRGNYNSQFANGHNTGHHQNQGHYTSTPPHFNSHPNSGQYQPQGSQPSPRVFRGSRSHPNHNNQSYNRFPNPNMQPPPAFMPTYPVHFEAYMMPPNGIPGHVELPGMVDIITQINYYFSVDNLCKDMFLRRHMDNDGYVKLSVIAKFNRLKILTQDLGVLQQACIQSQEVHLAPGDDDLYIRKAVGWETWVLNESEREPVARCGMSSSIIGSRQRAQQNSTSGSPLEMSGSAVPFMPDANRGRTQSGIAPGAPAFIPSGSYPVDVGSLVGSIGVTPLSANVPEFSPSTATLANGLAEDYPVPTDEFPDIDIGRLVVVCKRNGGGESSNTSPAASPSKPRSKGIVDGVNCVLTNGTASVPASPNESSFGNQSSDIGWLLEGDSGPHETAHKFVHKLYQSVLAQSLGQREASGPPKGEMITLYKFWSHFLLDKFNGQIYRDFKACALADADLSVRFGLEYLFKFYEDFLKERQEIHDSLIQDFVTLAKKDARNGKGLGPEKLASVIESSRLSAQNKQKIEALLDPEIRKVLEDGVEKQDGQLVESYAA